MHIVCKLFAYSQPLLYKLIKNIVIYFTKHLNMYLNLKRTCSALNFQHFTDNP
jgi:hypothetical protein